MAVVPASSIAFLMVVVSTDQRLEANISARKPKSGSERLNSVTATSRICQRRMPAPKYISVQIVSTSGELSGASAD